MLTFRDIDSKELLDRFMMELNIPKEDYDNLPLRDILDVLQQDFPNKVLEDAFHKVNEDVDLVLYRRIVLDNTLGDSYEKSTKEELKMMYENIITDESKRKQIEENYKQGINEFIANRYDTKYDNKYTRFISNASASYGVTFQDIINSNFDFKKLLNLDILTKLNYEFIHMKKDPTTFPLASLTERDKQTIISELSPLVGDIDEETLLKYYVIYVDNGTKNELLNTNDWLLDSYKGQAGVLESSVQSAVNSNWVTEAEALRGDMPMMDSTDEETYEYEQYDWGKDTTKVVDFLTEELNTIAGKQIFRDKSKRYVLNKFYSCLKRKTRLQLVKKYKYL